MHAGNARCVFLRALSFRLAAQLTSTCLSTLNSRLLNMYTNTNIVDFVIPGQLESWNTEMRVTNPLDEFP